MKLRLKKKTGKIEKAYKKGKKAFEKGKKAYKKGEKAFKFGRDAVTAASIFIKASASETGEDDQRPASQ